MAKAIGDIVGRVSGFHMGHPIQCDMIKVSATHAKGGDWYYTDNHELLDDAEPRACPKCKDFESEEGHDPCIKNLPGVSYACCGHGVDEPYVMLNDRRTYRGKDYYKIVEVIRAGKPIPDDIKPE